MTYRELVLMGGPHDGRRLPATSGFGWVGAVEILGEPEAPEVYYFSFEEDGRGYFIHWSEVPAR